MGITEFVTGCILGIVGVVGLLWTGFEIGKHVGLRKAEKMLDNAIRSRANDG